jgi:hypothetical protein
MQFKKSIDYLHICLLTYLFICAVVPRGPGRVFLGNVRSGMSRSHQYRILPLSHLAAWSIWFALSVRYFARNVSLLSNLFTFAGIRFQSSITRIPPLVQAPMLHFKVVGVSCAPCRSRTVLRSLEIFLLLHGPFFGRSRIKICNGLESRIHTRMKVLNNYTYFQPISEW